MIILKKLSLPYHTYKISHQKLWSQIFIVALGVCLHQISLQHLIHNLSAQAVAHNTTTINHTSKSFNIFMGDNNTQKTMNSNETRLTVAIFDLIISEGLCFNLAQKHRFKKVLYMERNVSNFISLQIEILYPRIVWM